MTGEAARHFAPYAAEYRRFRPGYPDALFDRVAALAPRRGRVWECGAGSGQATPGLAARFDEVAATDATHAQLACAPGLAGVGRVVALAEASPFAAARFDLVAVAQALHWFDIGAFVREARRVARPDAILAVWSYGMPAVSPDVDRVVRRLHDDVLGPYWRPERRHVVARYDTLRVPLPAIHAETLALEARWTLDRFRSYVGTWSAGREYEARHGTAPLARVDVELDAAWPGDGEAAIVRWPLTLRAYALAGDRA